MDARGHVVLALGVMLAGAPAVGAQGFGVDDSGNAVFAYVEVAAGHVQGRPVVAGTPGSQHRMSRLGGNASADVAVDAAGNATLCWRRGGAVFARRMPAGDPFGGSVLTLYEFGVSSDPEVAVNAAGDAVCVFTVEYWGFPSPGLPRYQVWAYAIPAGATKGLRRRVSSHAGEASAQRPRVAVAEDGRATITWLDLRYADGVLQRASVLARRLRLDGTQGPISTLDPEVSGWGNLGLYHDGSLDVAVAPDGAATILWEEAEAPFARVRGRRLLTDGTLSVVRTLPPLDWRGYKPHLAIDSVGTANVVFGTYQVSARGNVLGPGRLVRWHADGTVDSPMDVTSGQYLRSIFVGLAPDGDATVASMGSSFDIEVRRISGGSIVRSSWVGYASDLRGVKVSAEGTATLAWVRSTAFTPPQFTYKTCQMDPAGHLTPVRNVAYLR
jgi:hypothetical protein